METTLAFYLLQALEEMLSDKRTGRSVNFDSLVRAVQVKMHEPDLRILRQFGTRVDVVVASILAPLIETGEAVWEPASRRISVSDFGLLLLRSAEPLETDPMVHINESRVASL